MNTCDAVRWYTAAGDIHKQTQQYAREIVVPGARLMDIANQIEDKIKELTKDYRAAAGILAAGVAFPTGLSINNCAAHWTPNKGDAANQCVQKESIVKVDFGVQIQGCIIDGAISVTGHGNDTEELKELVAISEEATAIGIRNAGPDVHVYDIGCAVEEFIESHELAFSGGQPIGLKPVKDLCGHQIGKYMIHVGKPVPNIRFDAIKKDDRYKMKVGEVYAIEPYITTGSGAVTAAESSCSQGFYMANYMDPTKYNAKTLYTPIAKEFGTLAFCQRWLSDESLRQLDTTLVPKGIYSAYPPLYTEAGTYVAQTEKTICVTEKGVRVFN